MLLLATCRGRAQSPSGVQEQPQNHRDVPYQAEPYQTDPDQAKSYQAEPYGDSAPLAHQPLDAGQLEQLVAPIALYPDALVAQVLAASTYPRQVEDADRWRQAQGYASPGEIAASADAQGWDPSVKALTAFPQVLAQMDRNLQWTTDLGNAYYNQPQDVLEAVQVMRRRAQAAGSLRSSQQEVVRYDQGNIVLAPANPQVVYVPAYNPWAVYGEPVSPYPGFSLLGAIADIAGALPLRYGLGIAVSAFTQPWGWLAWGLDWLGHALLFHDSGYYSHSGTVANWGFPHHGFYAYSGRGGFDGTRGFGRSFGHESWGHEGWRRGGFNSGGWHSFRGNDLRARNGGEGSRGFESFRNERRTSESLNHRSFGSFGRAPENRVAHGSEWNRGASGFRAPESFRASAGDFPRNEFGNRASRDRSSQAFGGSGKSRSRNNFGGGRSGFFGSGGGGHAPKSFGGSHGFGGGKSFGGGHSHGGGGRHGGGSGKHHR